MRRALLALAAGLLLLAGPALAATTFSTDCAAGIAVSGGGLVLTTSGNAYKACRADTPKYSGKWYFEATLGATNSDISIGVANNGTAQAVSGGFSLTPGANISADLNSGGLLCANSKVGWWNNFVANASAACANGKTFGVAIGLDTNPPQIWATPDVTSLLCDGAGSAGSTNPQWNGTCTSDPTLPGTGGPTICCASATGFFLPGYAYFPTFVAFSSGSSATFNFGGSAFVGTVPTGFSSWNTVGGGAPTPGPTSPLNINIANAPVWQQSHAYGLGDRVVAGPGFTQPSTYTSGSTLYLWAVTVAGTSSGSGSGPQTCGTPANVGGGLNGSIPSGWSGKTTASDGGVTWVCLASVDYVTLTGAFNDSATTWAATTGYTLQQFVIKSGHAYVLSAVSSGNTCTSGGTGPTSTTMGGTTVDGTCTWTYQGDITYSSQAHRWPHELDLHAVAQHEAQFNYDVTLNVWYGGKQQQVYQTGSGGESSPIMMNWHSDLGADNSLECYNAHFNNSGLSMLGSGYGFSSCNGLMTPFIWNLTAASGDSFQENVSPASQALRVDSTKGVTFYSTASWTTGGGSGPNSPYTTGGEPVAFSDGQGKVTRIQFQSVNGNCIGAEGQGGPGGQHTNNIYITQAIFDCGSGNGAIGLDGANVITNSVIITRSAIAGSAAIHQKFPSPVTGNTIVCAGTTNQSALQFESQGAGIFQTGQPLFPPPFKNNVIIGCAVGFATLTGFDWASTLGANNATDQATGLSGTFTSAYTGTYNKHDFPGVGSTCVPPGNSSTCFSLTPSAIFINPTIGASIDLRTKSAVAPTYNGGATFSFATNGSWIGTLAPGNDVFSTARPISGRYDIGAEMFINPLGGFLFGPFGFLEPANDNWTQKFAKSR